MKVVSAEMRGSELWITTLVPIERAREFPTLTEVKVEGTGLLGLSGTMVIQAAEKSGECLLLSGPLTRSATKVYAVMRDEGADNGCSDSAELYFSNREMAEVVALKASAPWSGRYYVDEVDLDIDIERFKSGTFPYTYRARWELTTYKDGLKREVKTWGGPDLHFRGSYDVQRGHDRDHNLIGLKVSMWANSAEEVEAECLKIWDNEVVT